MDDVHKRCHCKKAKCLKLYCVCFSAGVYCSGCSCRDCMNTTAHQDAVWFERQRILQRSPRAFAPKVEQKLSGAVTHKKGCRCRKSRCLKKYCECFDAGVYCSNMCRCEDCQNQPDGSGGGDAEGDGGATWATPVLAVRSHAPLPTGTALLSQPMQGLPPLSSSGTRAAAAAVAAPPPVVLPPPGPKHPMVTRHSNAATSAPPPAVTAPAPALTKPTGGGRARGAASRASSVPSTPRVQDTTAQQLMRGAASAGQAPGMGLAEGMTGGDAAGAGGAPSAAAASLPPSPGMIASAVVAALARVEDPDVAHGDGITPLCALQEHMAMLNDFKQPSGGLGAGGCDLPYPTSVASILGMPMPRVATTNNSIGLPSSLAPSPMAMLQHGPVHMPGLADATRLVSTTQQLQGWHGMAPLQPHPQHAQQQQQYPQGSEPGGSATDGAPGGPRPCSIAHDITLGVDEGARLGLPFDGVPLQPQQQDDGGMGGSGMLLRPEVLVTDPQAALHLATHLGMDLGEQVAVLQSARVLQSLLARAAGTLGTATGSGGHHDLQALMHAQPAATAAAVAALQRGGSAQPLTAALPMVPTAATRGYEGGLLVPTPPAVQPVAADVVPTSSVASRPHPTGTVQPSTGMGGTAGPATAADQPQVQQQQQQQGSQAVTAAEDAAAFLQSISGRAAVGSGIAGGGHGQLSGATLHAPPLRATSSGPGVSTGKAMRLGSGSFRFTGVPVSLPVAKVTASDAAQPTDSGGVQLSAGIAFMGGSVLQRTGHMAAGAAAATNAAAESFGRRCHQAASAGDRQGADSSAHAGSVIATSSGRIVKRPRHPDEDDSTPCAMEASSEGAGAGVVRRGYADSGSAPGSAPTSPLSRAASTGRPRRFNAGKRFQDGPKATAQPAAAPAYRRPDEDCMDSANEMEALQALFEMGSRPASQDLCVALAGRSIAVGIGVSLGAPPMALAPAGATAVRSPTAQCAPKLLDPLAGATIICEATGQVA